MTQISRRTVVHGSAWSIPAVTVAASSPALAASPACANVSTYVLTTYANTLPDLTGAIIRVQHNMTLAASDGTTQQDYINFYNVGNRAVNFSTANFPIQITIARDSTSTNSNIAEPRAWSVEPTYSDMDFWSVDGTKYFSHSVSPGTSDAAKLPDGSATFVTKLNKNLTTQTYTDYNATDGAYNTLVIQYQDGAAAGGRIKSDTLVTPLGYPAPTPAQVLAATGIDVTAGSACATAYNEAVTTWNTNNVGMRGVKFEAVGPNTATQFNWYDADTNKTVQTSAAGTTFNSKNQGNFNSGSGQVESSNGIF